MTRDELLRAAEAKLLDADKNIVGCVEALNQAKKLHGGVPNAEVLALVVAQAAVGHALATVALAKPTAD